jgi:hypothetical protein
MNSPVNHEAAYYEALTREVLPYIGTAENL